MRGEYRPDRFCSAHGPLALLRVSEVCCSLSRRCSRQRLLLAGPVSGDGFRSVDLPRELARYRGMLAFDERQAVPHGLPWPSGTHHAGRCQREPRLADLRRLRAGVDRHRPANPSVISFTAALAAPYIVCPGTGTNPPMLDTFAMCASGRRSRWGRKALVVNKVPNRLTFSTRSIVEYSRSFNRRKG